MAEGGCAPGARPPPFQQFRLKRSLQPIAASDGCLYLLRSGLGDDFVLGMPARHERRIIEALHRGWVDRVSLARAAGVSSRTIDDALDDLAVLGLLERRADDDLLTDYERKRFDRQLIYFADLADRHSSGPAIQRRLDRGTVAILGCGGLGSWAASALAAAGIGRILLIDDDRVELSNLNRQLLFSESDIGLLKVNAAAAALKVHNANLDVVSIAKEIDSAERLSALVSGADVLVATADRPPDRLPGWINSCCLKARLPYISAGQFLPQIRIGPMVLPGESACQACLETQARASFPLFDEVAAVRARDSNPASTLGAASGLVGSILAMEVIHLLGGACRPATVGQAWILDVRTLGCEFERVHRDPNCPDCRTSLEAL